MKPHFDGRRYHFPDAEPPNSGWSALRWAVTRRPARWPRHIENPPADPVDNRVESDRLRVTTINHATVLVQSAGMNILTDPVFSKRVSPVRFAGPARHRKPGLTLDELPPIDVVLISHSHYDHMDIRSIQRLNEKYKPRFVTPLGNRRIFDSDQSRSAVELDWWETHRVNSKTEITLVPARHWSSRTALDANRALWGGFAIRLPSGLIYFAGDTGYGDGRHFSLAREKLGHFRLALLPIGAYEPRWFMKPQHMNPAEAVQAFIDLQAAYALGIHFGTFRLTDEAHDSPQKDLNTALAQAPDLAGRFQALLNGQHWDVP